MNEETKWTPITEGYPMPYKMVALTYYDSLHMPRVGCGMLTVSDKLGDCFYVAGVGFVTATAWIDLPKPYDEAPPNDTDEDAYVEKQFKNVLYDEVIHRRARRD